MCAQHIPARPVFGVEIEVQTVLALGIAQTLERSYHIYTFPVLAPEMFNRLPDSLKRSGKKPSLLELVIDKHDPAVFAIEAYDRDFVMVVKAFFHELLWLMKPTEPIHVTRAGLRLLAYHTEPLQLSWGIAKIPADYPVAFGSPVMRRELWINERLLLVTKNEPESVILTVQGDREVVSLVEQQPALFPGDLPVYSIERVLREYHAWSDV